MVHKLIMASELFLLCVHVRKGNVEIFRAGDGKHLRTFCSLAIFRFPHKRKVLSGAPTLNN